MEEYLKAAESLEKLGVFGLMMGGLFVAGIVIRYLIKRLEHCQSQLLKAIQGKELE